MRMRNDATECVKEVLKSRIIKSFTFAKLGGFLHTLNDSLANYLNVKTDKSVLLLKK